MYQRIVILTGAGISAESGLRTFRAEDGLWEQHRIEDVATPEGYWRNPDLVHKFYNQRWQQLREGVEANPAHHALAKLEREFSGEVMLVTQNIDNLHEQAGNKQVLHMHGELVKGRCPKSQQVFPLVAPFGPDNLCTCCVMPQVLRPHVVWFGEMPFGLDRTYEALAKCDLFIAIGTSGTVYPAAGFVEQANQAGAETLEVNLAPTERYSQFDFHRQGKAGDEVPKVVELILDGQLLA
ncbi:Sir2 family NAD+-dependent deacetylase [Ferrimonas lipolytica]|uniref:NAD-dependent protein deacylase n=1 Tax=Ferrimonas lipolytica TaxID=2724191 RepID=A0A6H1UAE2_9GAMM|nr:Sir2 family NAD+-dependent deacetylase [Ferrimonas lipolytica]QIZ76027.1 NAD-dependent protein deacylase [Ferrimonas lipolytica]